MRLVGGGSVINRPTPSNFYQNSLYFLHQRSLIMLLIKLTTFSEVKYTVLEFLKVKTTQIFSDSW